MKTILWIRTSLVADLFVNLSAGWFGLILISPALVKSSFILNLLDVGKAAVNGGICLLIAEILKKEESI